MSDGVERRHATAVAFGKRGVLILGASGWGKSDLALRLLAVNAAPFALGPPLLVADDQVVLTHTNAGIIASAPPTLRGLLEVRGAGILTLDVADSAMIALVAELVRDETVDRMPDPWPTREILGFAVPVLRVRAFEASAPLKICAALTMSSLPPVSPKQ